MKALKIKNVAIQSFLNALFEKASLKLHNISFKLPPIVLTVNGFNVAFKNSGGPGVSKTFDYLAKGY